MDARPFDWADLEIFLAVGRGGTLAVAAKLLSVDASTVQRRIGKLEAALQTQLFERSQRGYSLTSAGEELLAHVREMDQQAMAAKRKVAARDNSVQGCVRVATVDDLAFAVLPPIVRAFRKQNPKVTVELDIRTSFADLAKRQADVAIRFGGRLPEADLIAKQVSRVDVALYASRAYLKEHGRPARLEDLNRHAIVRGNAQVSSLPHEKLMDRYGDPANVALSSNSFLARLAAIRDGMGIGFLGCFMGEREKSIERLPFRFPEASGYLWLVLHVDLKRNARVRAFVEHTYAAMSALRSSFESPLVARS
jgi:DNA-binding transcriptional LysR family regulator